MIDTGSKHRLAILGSCVTRDLFTHVPEALDQVELGPYVSRATLISMAGNVPRVVVARLGDHVAKRFDDRRFVLDARKDYFRVLAKYKPETVVLDLIDERHATYLFDEGALTVTKVSKEFLVEHGMQQLPRVVSPFSPDWWALQERSARALILRLRTELPSTRFIVHAAPYALRYLTGGEVRNFHEPKPSRHWSAYLGPAYESLAAGLSYALSYLAGGHVRDSPDLEASRRWNAYLGPAYESLAAGLVAPRIGVGPDCALAGGQHLWDLTPYHYDVGYYRSLWAELAALIGRPVAARLSS